jgi:hypothetical protein
MEALIDRLRGALAETGLEHVFVVRAGGNELLTRFEHTL